MGISVFMFTRFEGDTGGDEVLLKIVMQGICKNKDVKEINVFVKHDQDSNKRVQELCSKLTSLFCEKKIQVFSHLMDKNIEFPSSVRKAIESLEVDKKSLVEGCVRQADIFVIAGWGHLQDKKDAEYIIQNVNKEAKILICCPPGSCLYETQRNASLILKKQEDIAAKKRSIEKDEKYIARQKNLIENNKKSRIPLDNKIYINQEKRTNPEGDVKNKLKDNIKRAENSINRAEENIISLQAEIKKLEELSFEPKVFIETLLKEKDLEKNIFIMQLGFSPFSGLPLFVYPNVQELDSGKYRIFWIDHLKQAEPTLPENLINELLNISDTSPRCDENFIVIYCSKDQPNNVETFLKKIDNIEKFRIFLIGPVQGSDNLMAWQNILTDHGISDDNIHVLPRTSGEDGTLILMQGLKNAKYCMATGSFSILEALYCGIYNIHYLAPPHINKLFKDSLQRINIFNDTEGSAGRENNTPIQDLLEDFQRGTDIVEKLSELTTLGSEQKGLLAPILKASKKEEKYTTTTTTSIFKKDGTNDEVNNESKKVEIDKENINPKFLN